MAGDHTGTSEKVNDGKFIVQKYREEKLGETGYVEKINEELYESVDSSELLDG